MLFGLLVSETGRLFFVLFINKTCHISCDFMINENRPDFGVNERKKHRNFMLCIKTFHTKKATNTLERARSTALAVLNKLFSFLLSNDLRLHGSSSKLSLNFF